MKRLLTFTVTICILNLGSAQESGSSLSKAEKKQLISQAKRFKKNPASLKKLLDDRNELQKEAAEMNELLSEAQSQLISLQAELDESSSTNQSLLNQLDQLKSEMSEVKNNAETKGFRLPEVGNAFRVQIGGYKKRDLTDLVDNTSENIQLETNESGIQEITVGQFTDYWKADILKKHLRAMGVTDSWIVPYKDGQRVLLKEILEEIERKSNVISQN